MRKTLAILYVTICVLVGSTTYSVAEDNAQTDQLASEAAKTFARVIKPSYKTLKDFTFDYESGKNQLDAKLNLLAIAPSDQVQYRDNLLSQIESYNQKIKSLINHDDFDARVQPYYQSELANMNAKKSLMTPPAWAQAMGQRGFAKGVGQMFSPEKAMEQAKQDVIDSDNKQASQFQTERDELQRQVDTLDSAQDKLQDKILEMKANAESAYGDYVYKKVKDLTNMSSALKESALAFVNKDQMDEHMKLFDLRMKLQSRTLERQARVATINTEHASSSVQQPQQATNVYYNVPPAPPNYPVMMPLIPMQPPNIPSPPAVNWAPAPAPLVPPTFIPPNIAPPMQPVYYNSAGRYYY